MKVRLDEKKRNPDYNNLLLIPEEKWSWTITAVTNKDISPHKMLVNNGGGFRKELLDFKVLKEPWVLKVVRDFKVDKVPKEPLDLKELKGEQDYKVLVGHKGLKDQQVLKEAKDLKEVKDHKGLLDLRVHKVIKDLLGLKVI